MSDPLHASPTVGEQTLRALARYPSRTAFSWPGGSMTYRAATDLIVKHRNTDAAGQAADIRDLVAAGVDAIVFNPNDPAALNPALQEAKAAGIKTVSVDAWR